MATWLFSSSVVRVLAAVAVVAAAAFGCLLGGLGLLASTAAVRAADAPRLDWLGVALTTDRGGDFGDALEDGFGLGMGFTTLSVQWDDLEVEPGRFAPSPDWLSIAAEHYPGIDLPVMLAVNPIDTNRRRTPADLADQAWDDPVVIERFRGVLRDAAERTRGLTLVGLALGNEVDVHLGGDPAAWAAYGVFFEAVAAEARTLWPGVPVGVKLTADGLSGPRVAEARSLARRGDVVMANLYPLDEAFRVIGDAAVSKRLDGLAAAAGDRPLWLTEFGCPSGGGGVDGGGERRQAEVYASLGRWRSAAGGVPERVTVVWLNDLPAAAAEAMAAGYGVEDGAFVSFLATLGVQNAAGDAKPAADAIRGWGR